MFFYRFIAIRMDLKRLLCWGCDQLSIGLFFYFSFHITWNYFLLYICSINLFCNIDLIINFILKFVFLLSWLRINFFDNIFETSLLNSIIANLPHNFLERSGHSTCRYPTFWEASALGSSTLSLLSIRFIGLLWIIICPSFSSCKLLLLHYIQFRGMMNISLWRSRSGRAITSSNPITLSSLLLDHSFPHWWRILFNFEIMMFLKPFVKWIGWLLLLSSIRTQIWRTYIREYRI